MPYHIESSTGEYKIVDGAGKVMGTHPTRKQAVAQLQALYANVDDAKKKEVEMEGETDKAVWSTAQVNDLPDSSFLYIESGGEKDGDGRTTPRSLRHFPYKDADGKIDLPHLRNAIARIPQSNAPGLNKDAVQKRAQKILADNTDAASAEGKEAKEPGALDKILTFFKEGRRHSATDQDAIQQIHDLSTQAGADCPMMVMKQANGQSRWVLLSSNAYQDRDGEFVSMKAQKKDTERMTETKEYGPLRLWHLGYPDVEKKDAGPGVDIGDCDYSQMFDRVRVESGTFRNERVAAAIKERANQWATSVGFFHPVEEPDSSGTYHNIYTFERSLLPRSKAANALTPLAAIYKENSMTTKEEKISQLTKLLGSDELAAEVLKQADATEKAAQERGLKYKEETPAPATAEVTAEKSGKKNNEPDEDDLGDMDEATQKSYKAMLPHIVKAIHNLTKKDNIEGKKERKIAKKERKAIAATMKDVDEMKVKIDQIAAAVAELNGELPKALASGYRATQSDLSLLDTTTIKQGDVPDPLGAFMAEMFKYQQPGNG